MISYLLDTSALVRLHRNKEMRQVWQPTTDAGAIGLCEVTELEMLYTARSSAHREEILSALDQFYAWVLMPERVYGRAREVQAALTQRGQHRSAGAVDLLVAATAELTGRTLLHYDRDFETVAAATGQPARWLSTPGSID